MLVSEFLSTRIIKSNRLVTMLENGIENIEFSKKDLEAIDEFQNLNPDRILVHVVAENFDKEKGTEYGYIRFEETNIAIYKKSFFPMGTAYKIVDRKKYLRFIRLLMMLKTDSTYRIAEKTDDLSSWLPVNNLTVDKTPDGLKYRAARKFESWKNEELVARVENMSDFECEGNMSYASGIYFENTIKEIEEELGLRGIICEKD